MDKQTIDEAGAELVLELYDWIKKRQWRFIIEGEEGYSGGVYVIKILDPFHYEIIKFVKSYEYTDVKDNEPKLVDMMKAGLIKLLGKEPDFFRTYEIIKEKG